jgi:hypothetical protein
MVIKGQSGMDPFLDKPICPIGWQDDGGCPAFKKNPIKAESVKTL